MAVILCRHSTWFKYPVSAITDIAMYCSEKEFNCHVQTDMNTFYLYENIVALVLHISSVQVRMSEAVLVLHVAWLRFISKSKQLMMQNI